MPCNSFTTTPLTRFNPALTQDDDDPSLLPVPTLRCLSLDASIKMITTTIQGSGRGGRDAKRKKMIRRFLDEMLPREIQKDLISRAVRKKSSSTVLNLMETFEPKSVVQDEVDLIGNFRNVHVCCYLNNANVMVWMIRSLDILDLDDELCQRLHQYVQWSLVLERKSLRKFAISTEPDALGRSNLPNILARSPFLTSVTILTGCTNHILRILGRSCPVLQSLDVSLSAGVTDAGLAGLLLKKWRSRCLNPFAKLTPAWARALRPEDKYPIATSLRKLLFVGTGVSQRGINLTCVLLGESYFVGFYPDSLITRPLGGRNVEPEGKRTIRMEMGDSLLPLFGGDENEEVREMIEYIVKRCTEGVEIDEGEGPENRVQYLDHYSVKEWGYGQSFIRGEDSSLTEAVIGTRLNGNKFYITELILTFHTFNWNAASFPDLTELGINLPTLVVFKGRIQGTWGHNGDRVLFPNLAETDLWTVNDGTVLSFLEFCPRIRIFKFNCLDAIPPINPSHVLNDTNFRRCLGRNDSILQTLSEFFITVLRSGPHLSLNSVRLLIQSAPRLRRLGDLGCWNLVRSEVFELEKELRKNNSAVALIKVAFPPKEKVEYLL